VDRSLARLLRRTFGRRWRRDVAVASAASYRTALRREFQERCGLDLLAADAAGTLDALVPEAERVYWRHSAAAVRAATTRSTRRGRGRS
jgi:hypothetical protein